MNIKENSLCCDLLIIQHLISINTILTLRYNFKGNFLFSTCYSHQYVGKETTAVQACVNGADIITGHQFVRITLLRLQAHFCAFGWNWLICATKHYSYRPNCAERQPSVKRLIWIACKDMPPPRAQTAQVKSWWGVEKNRHHGTSICPIHLNHC